MYLSATVLYAQISMNTNTETPFGLLSAAKQQRPCLFVSLYAEHMMTGIPSCSGLDVIPNTGLRNGSENNTQFAK